MTGMYQVMPALEPEQYQQLKNDIAERGVQVPVEYDEAGNILDGYHRVQACGELGIKDWPRIIRVGLSEEEKRAHARKLNIFRRHLDRETRRGLIGAQLRETPQLSDRQIAGALGVDHKTVGAVRDGLESIGEIPQCERKTTDGRAYPAQRKASIMALGKQEATLAFDALSKMDAGELPDKPLSAKRVARLSREYQAQERAKDAPAEVVDGDVTLLQGDFRERGLEIATESVDLIFTDPPYPREFLPLWSDLSAFAARVLKPNGMLIAYTGALDLPEVIGRLSEHLTYWWCGAIVMPGAHSRVHPRQIVQGVKPLLFYVKSGGKPEAWVEDSYQSEGEEKQAHEWQQSLGAALYYIEKLTPAGGVVVDPFLGGGTTGVAAKRLGRHFVGMEIDPVAFATAQERIVHE
jgi:hypothetical protein